MGFDVVIVGGGPGGTAAAKALATAGKSVAIVEDKHLGGTCLNCGCIPTKMLLGATAPIAMLHANERVRVMKGSLQVDYAALQNRVTRFVKGSSQTLSKSLIALGVTLYEGRAECVASGRVRVHGAEGVTEIEGGQVILATGSRSACFPGLTPDNDAVLDSTALLQLAAVPESLLIVGAGAIGLELGDFFHALGTKVTIVEAAAHVAPTEDADIAADLERTLTKSGKTCIVGVKAQSLVTRDGQAELTLADGRVLTATKALVAVGRTPNTDTLNVSAAGGTLAPRGFVAVDSNLVAGTGLYAIGDCNGLTLLAHAAEHQAHYVARRILGQESGPYVPGPVPSCIYGSTEVMRVGQTAKALETEGKSPTISQVPLSANAIAQATGSTTGFVKVVWDGDTIVGIAAVGHGVSHLVTVAQLLVLHGYNAHSLHKFMCAHPTLDEIVVAAILAK